MKNMNVLEILNSGHSLKEAANKITLDDECSSRSSRHAKDIYSFLNSENGMRFVLNISKGDCSSSDLCIRTRGEDFYFSGTFLRST